ncbi:MAG: hypothetical protein MRY64_00535 [Hyphomonadaceae bacterium]|nr:hypothetical protein [Hyphomonadaceae bacterium]
MTRSILASLALLALAAHAEAATISVSYSEDFAEKLAEDYGEREGPILTDDIIEDIERALDRANVDAERIEVTIEDARPNRPTMQQVSDRPGLDSFRSFGTGGMKLTGKVYHLDGEMVSDVEYRYFETDISQVQHVSTWWDANRASRRFASRVVDAITGE